MKYKTTLQLILIGLVIMCFSRCSTPEKLITRALSKDSAAVAKVTRDLFPCTEVLRPDTAIMYVDSVVYVDCPDTTRPSPYEVYRTDTVLLAGQVRTIRVPVHVPVQIRTVTRYYEDSAKIFLFRKQVERLQGDTAQLKKNLTSMTGNRNWYRKWFFIELGLLLILIILALWKFWKRLTTIKIR
jgi:hypothetical protein